MKIESGKEKNEIGTVENPEVIEDDEIGDECTCFETGQEECPLHGNPL